MSEAVQLWGVPERLDRVWRPLVRAVLIGLGLVGGAILVWLSAWVWVPLPLVVAVILYEGIFWLRGDRPISVRLAGHQVKIVDRKTGHAHEVDLNDVETAGIGFRRGRGLDDVVVTLYGAHDVLLAVRIHTQSQTWPVHATDLDALQPMLGGRPNLIRGLAPPDRLVRQILPDYDGRGLRYLLAHLPPSSFEGAAARVWRGSDPPMNFMGHHSDPCDGLIRLTASAWTAPDGEQGPLRTAGGGRAERSYRALSLDDEPAERIQLPVVIWDFEGGLRLGLPSSLAGRQGPSAPLSHQVHHVHLPEGANLVWFLLRHLEPGDLPESLALALRDARIAYGELPPPMARHLSPRITGSEDPPLPA